MVCSVPTPFSCGEDLMCAASQEWYGSFSVDIRSCKAYGQTRAKESGAARRKHDMGEQEKKLEYVRPKLEEMFMEGTTGTACSNGSANAGTCSTGTSAGSGCSTGTGFLEV